MERIIVKENNQNYHLFFLNKNLKVLRFDSRDIKNPLAFLNSLYPSSKSYKIQENNEEIILYDPDTNLYHKLVNGKEDWTYFFYHNGESTACGKEKSPNIGSRIFRIKNFIICLSLSALLFCTGCNFPISIDSEYYSTATITVDYLKEAIYSSNELTEEEKEYLFNEDFLTDILPFINDTNYLKWKAKTSFKDMAIISFETLEDEPNTKGYYQPDNPNRLYMRNYQSLNRFNEDVLSHEFVHLCQDTRGYNLIIEACAEIISSEYFAHTQLNTYPEATKLVKILMEIIGPEVIWNYNFTNDFKPIEEKVKPYLSEQEYQEFIKDLTFDTTNNDLNLKKYDSFLELLEKLYERKFQSKMEDNEVIALIKKNYPYLTRYYFNHRLMDQEHSYYTVPKEGEYETISYEEAISEGLLIITAIDKRPVTHEEAMKLLEQGEGITREIDYSNSEASIISTSTSQTNPLITFIYDHKRYTNMNMDEAFEKGYIKINYYHIVSIKECTYEEYINHDFNETTSVYLSYNGDSILQDDGFYCFLLTKHYLPPVKTEENNYQYIKK